MKSNKSINNKQRKQYTPQFKEQTLELVEREGVANITQQFAVTPS